MTISRRHFATLLGAAVLSGCGRKFRTYSGPRVTHVVVHKQARQIQLMHEGRILKTYPMEMGFAPQGHKQFEGDGRTPEGTYVINRRNPRSQYHLSIGISYPNRADVARARAAGRSPGGDIFIHGTPRYYVGKDDWTAGCIAVSNRHMEEIYAMVGDGTLIVILP